MEEEEKKEQSDCCNEAAYMHQTTCCNKEGGAVLEERGSEENEGAKTRCCKAFKDDESFYESDDYENEEACCGAYPAAEQEGCCGARHAQGAAQREEINASNEVRHTAEALPSLLKAAHEKYMRLYAEFDNFKKRSAKERIVLTEQANAQTLTALLPILDDFERSLAAFSAQQESMHMQDAIQDGINLIYDKLSALLKRFGVAEMRLEAGSAFNADFHEAIMQQPVEDPAMKGNIIAVAEKGYLIQGHVLRFAKVVIGV